MKKTIMLTIAMIFCLFTVAPPVVTAATVTGEVKSIVDDVLKIVTNKELSKPQNEQKRRAALKAVIGRIFDYGEMSRRSLGVHWRTLKPAQQKEFTNLFATLLENSYAGKIESYRNEKIVYENESVDGDYAEVKSRIVTAKRDEYALIYKLVKKGGKWVVYDVVIEGVSLVSNYRSQFNKIINQSGYDELVKKLRTKSDEIAAP